MTSRISVTAGWYHRTYQDLQQLDRTLITTSDYTSFTIPTPDVSRDATLDGVIPRGPLTVYNLNAAKRSVFNSAQVDKNVDDQSIYNGFDRPFNARLLAGSTLFGSWTIGAKRVGVLFERRQPERAADRRSLHGACRSPTAAASAISGKFDMPFVHEFKLAGSYPVPYVGVDVSVVVQSYAGLARTITYQPAGQPLFPDGRTNTETIILNEPGSLYYPRYNQLDLNFKKNFRTDRRRSAGRSTSSTC